MKQVKAAIEKGPIKVVSIEVGRRKQPAPDEPSFEELLRRLHRALECFEREAQGASK